MQTNPTSCGVLDYLTDLFFKLVKEPKKMLALIYRIFVFCSRCFSFSFDSFDCYTMQRNFCLAEAGVLGSWFELFNILKKINKESQFWYVFVYFVLNLSCKDLNMFKIYLSWAWSVGTPPLVEAEEKKPPHGQQSINHILTKRTKYSLFKYF